MRTGLSNVPAVTWQYRVKVHFVSGAGNTWYEVEGAQEIDLPAVKALFEGGALFIDVNSQETWRALHIPGAVNLPRARNKDDPTAPRFFFESVAEVATKESDIVLYCFEKGCNVPAFQAAKAANWGYRKVHYFDGGAQAWKAAGYPTEAGD